MLCKTYSETENFQRVGPDYTLGVRLLSGLGNRPFDIVAVERYIRQIISICRTTNRDLIIMKKKKKHDNTKTPF